MKQTMLGLAVLLAAGAHSGIAATTGFPFTDESLEYTVNWPSGLSLGEGHLRAKHSGTQWTFELRLDAAVPGFEVKDLYGSESNNDFCAVSFRKESLHGSRKRREKEVVDRSRATVARETSNGGGKSEFPVPDCIKDALGFLFYTRRELGQGRVPPPQEVLFGPLYQARWAYGGLQTVQVSGQYQQADKMVCTFKGPSSGMTFEIYFARDPVRTPLIFRVPLALGRFSMELVR